MDSEVLAAIIMGLALKKAAQPSVTVMQKNNISSSELETIVSITAAAREKVGDLSDLCKVISMMLDSKHSLYKWNCIASEDTGMVGYVSSCEGFIKFKFGPYTFIVSATRK